MMGLPVNVPNGLQIVESSLSCWVQPASPVAAAVKLSATVGV